MDRLVDLIKVYDNDLEDDVCDYLVYHFEKSFNRHKKTLRNRTPNFTEYNLEAIMDGQINSILENLKLADQQAQLATFVE